MARETDTTKPRSNPHYLIVLFVIVITCLHYSLQNGVVTSSCAQSNKQLTQRIEINVSETGEDSPTCGTTTSPCASIPYAVNQSVPGDTIMVGSGSFSLSQPISLPNNVLLTGAGCASSSNITTNITIVPTNSNDTAMITMNYNSTLMCLSLSQTTTSSEEQWPIIFANLIEHSQIIIQSTQFQSGAGGIRVIPEKYNSSGVLWLYDVDFSEPGGVIIDGSLLTCSTDIDDPLSGISLVMDQISIFNSSFPLITGNFSPFIHYTNMELDLIKGEEVINTNCHTKVTLWENNQISQFTNNSYGVTYEPGIINLKGEFVSCINFSYINSVNGYLYINAGDGACNSTDTTAKGCSLYMSNVTFTNVTSNYAGFYIYNVRNTIIENNSLAQYFSIITNTNGEEVSANTTMRNCTWSVGSGLDVQGNVKMDRISFTNGVVFLSGEIHLSNSYFSSDYSSSVFMTAGDLVMENVQFGDFMSFMIDGCRSIFSTNLIFNGIETKEKINGLIFCMYCPIVYLEDTQFTNYVINDDRDVISIQEACAITLSGGSYSNVTSDTFIDCSSDNSIVTFAGNATEFSDCHFNSWWKSDDCTLACTSLNDHVCSKVTEREVLIWGGIVSVVILIAASLVGCFFYYKRRKQNEETVVYDTIND